MTTERYTYAGVIDLGDLVPDSAEQIDRELQNAIYDALDDLGVNYRVICSTVTSESQAKSALNDPDENQMGPFSKDSSTSRSAALDNYPRSGSQRWKVFTTIAYNQSEGATRDELAETLDLPDSSTDARVWELLGSGWIEETDKTRATQHGSQASVLTVSDKGAKHFESREGVSAI